MINFHSDATQDANQFLTDVNFIKEVANLVSNQLATHNQVTTQVTNQNANQLNLFSGKSENAVPGSGGLCPISTKEEEETPAPATVAEPEPLDNSDSSDKIISVSGKVNDETLTESELKQLPSENELIDEEKAEGIITSEGKKEAITGDSEGANLKPLPQEFLDLPKGKLTATKISKTLEVSNGTVTNWANKKQKPHYGPCVERGRKTAVSV